MVSGKIVAIAVSVVLIVGVAISAVVLVQNQRNGRTKTSENILSPQMKLAYHLCNATSYQESCIKTIGSVNSTDPKEFIMTAILEASEAVKQAFNFSDDIIVKAQSSPQTKMALEDCKDLFNNAVQELQASISTVGDGDLHTVTDRVDELESWISSIFAYQQLCLDGFYNDATIKPVIENGMVDASHLTDNVLAIIAALSAFLKSVGLQFDAPSPGNFRRRLFSLREDGFPTWFSAADRKLLAANSIRPSAIVAQDGSGHFKTIHDALAAYPQNLRGRYIIYVKAGVYNEYPLVTRFQPNVYIYGDGPTRTIVVGNRSKGKGGLNTWKTATFAVEGDRFMAKSIGFSNTAGPDGLQAVALRVSSDMSIFYDCQIDGYQDTLLYEAKRQFYRDCTISGTIDFIFGYGAAVIQNSVLQVKKPKDGQQNTITADGRIESHATTGIVIHNCKIIADKQLFPHRFKIPTYLGRPWKAFSRAIVMESEIGDLIQPQGWMPWHVSVDNLYYAEYANTGLGANTKRRVIWRSFHVIGRNEAVQFTPGVFLQGGWIKAEGVPVNFGLVK